MKKSIFWVFLALLCLFCTSVSFADSEISVTDLDGGERCSWYTASMQSTTIFFTSDTSEILHYKDALEWNQSTNHASSAEMPSPDIFNVDLEGIEGPKEVKVHLRLTLSLENATISGDQRSEDPSSVESLTTPFLIETIRFASARRYTGDVSDNADATNIIIIDAQGGVQSIAATGTYTERNGMGTIYNQGAADGLDIPDAFPLTVYAVSYNYEKHGISVTQQENGNITPGGDEDGVVSVPRGRDQTFTIIPESGYQVAHLIVDGEEVEPDNKLSATYTFTRVLDDGHTISAVFEPYSGAEVCTDYGIVLDVTSITGSESNPTVTEFEALGFADGSRSVNIIGSDGTETGGTFVADGFVQAFTASISYEEGYGSGSISISVPAPAEGFDTDKSYYVIALNRTTNYYDLWEAELGSDGSLNAAVKPVSDYAPDATFFVYCGTATETGETPETPPADTGGGGASGSGCSAGLSSLALLAFAPMLALRRRP